MYVKKSVRIIGRLIMFDEFPLPLHPFCAEDETQINADFRR